MGESVQGNRNLERDGGGFQAQYAAEKMNAQNHALAGIT